MLQILLVLLYGAILYISIFMMLTLLEAETVESDLEWRNSWPSLTVIVPAYNEEDCLGMTLESVVAADYPEKEVIVVDDGSTDSTGEIAREYEDEGVKVISQQNQGKGAALNAGLEEADTELVSCVDADSELKENSLKNIVSEMDDDAAGIACAMKVREPQNRLEKLQEIEYVVGILMRKIMGMMDAIHITPGPLAVYRRKKLEEVGGFDEDSLVEDQEICWRLQDRHEKLQHSRHGEAYTEAPRTLKGFYDQRTRWWTGSFEEFIRYRHMILNPDYGDLGMFMAPAKIVQAGLSIAGLSLMLYLTFRPVVSLGRDVAILGLDALSLPFAGMTPERLANFLYWQVFANNFVLLSALGSLFFFSLSMVYIASVHTEYDVREFDVVSAGVYVFWFFAISGFLSLISVFNVLTSRRVEW